jgi:hypothetical protein
MKSRRWKTGRLVRLTHTPPRHSGGSGTSVNELLPFATERRQGLYFGHSTSIQRHNSRLQSLLDIRDHVFDVFDSDAEPHQSLCDATRFPQFSWNASVSHGCRMAAERLNPSQTFC